MKFEVTTYSLEVSMNHVAGVQIREPLCDIGYLATGVSLGWTQQEKRSHEFKSICVGVLFDVFREVPTGHPIRNELEGSDSDT